jgi:peptide/nickel transport system permease protein
MARFAIGRLAGLAAILVALVAVVFVIQSVVPNDPARIIAGRSASPAAVERVRHELGLDQSLPTQFADYVGRLARGDLAMSVSTRRPVADDLRDAVPASLELLACAALLCILLGLAGGILTALPGARSGAMRGGMIVLASIPNFCLAVLALLLLYDRLGWFPGAGRVGPDTVAPDGPTGSVLADSVLHLEPAVFLDALHHVALPALCLAIGPAMLIARTLRSALLVALASDYARTARAKGLTETQVLVRHGVRNALNAPLTIGGLQVGAMLAGIAVVETVFAWPGLGQYTTRAIAAQDFPAIAGITLVTGLVFVLANALVDVAQVAADPRLRPSR